MSSILGDENRAKKKLLKLLKTVVANGGVVYHNVKLIINYTSFLYFSSPFACHLFGRI